VGKLEKTKSYVSPSLNHPSIAIAIFFNLFSKPYIDAETVPEPATIFGSFMALGGLTAFQRKNKQLKGLRSRGR
jgi:hypothetical protein